MRDSLADGDLQGINCNIGIGLGICGPPNRPDSYALAPTRRCASVVLEGWHKGNSAERGAAREKVPSDGLKFRCVERPILGPHWCKMTRLVDEAKYTDLAGNNRHVAGSTLLQGSCGTKADSIFIAPALRPRRRKGSVQERGALKENVPPPKSPKGLTLNFRVRHRKLSK